MRLWSLHPRYLDSRGLVALWREGLLARKVLRGLTKGYKHHPQLVRFRTQPNILQAIDGYLIAVFEEAEKRGYQFDRTKIGTRFAPTRIPVSRGQLHYELQHLKKKLKVRDHERGRVLRGLSVPKAHPLFRVVKGEIESWEREKG